MITFGSLFSGIGGIDLGLERAGMQCAWQVEIDEFCNKVLRKHWPDVKRFTDVRTVGEHNLESVDVIAGGFPCQDISQAGHKIGIDGERSGLWSEFHRIVRELRPRIVFVENVPGLLKRGLGRVLGDLAACGYDAEWQSIPAAAVGAPHIRDRVWILAYPGQKYFNLAEGRIIEPSSRRSCMLPKGNDRQATEWREHRELIAMVPGIHQGMAEDWWRSQSRMDRSANGVPDCVDRTECLGNAVVPQVAEWIGRRIIATDNAP